MNPVPSSPDPERRPAAEQAAGRRRSSDVPALSVGCLDDVRPGSLLVALPGLVDPTFAGAVVYVLDHADTGTIGVVLGRPSEVRIGDVLPGWSELAVAPEVFHIGGPVEADTALCLATRRGSDPLPADSGLRQVAGAVHLVDLDSDPDELDGEIGGLRVFAGYAGWSHGQLADELADGAWACVTGLPGDLLTGASGPELWRSVLRRQSGRLGVLSTAPADPSAN
ncbi:YqgE/AlgH family protein [Modestobacter sp. VKM Ac-2986]|uniref:YqgE/AlgH family protein n=1 Tax=Modestobacter sp. VKM Ac-2986 TaxID=3004140 RepID=UPI0022AB2A9A|nr:YqgE/AlgH family protein [Modestobacter sp. VKM Ac-2986]MCZ2827404.1 YqgE/AlgH family protein [Modestobacter sp. VKM Ac-2986]